MIDTGGGNRTRVASPRSKAQNLAHVFDGPDFVGQVQLHIIACGGAVGPEGWGISRYYSCG